jgi:hypothetical protein
MAEPRILVRGEGVAGTCCLQLLDQQGVNCEPEDAKTLRLDSLLIGQGTQKLLRDIFAGSSDDLFAGFPVIRKRIVAWGSGAQVAREPLVLAHLGVVAAEEELLRRLRARLPTAKRDSDRGDPAWTIVAARPTDGARKEMHFGSRRASVREVELAEEIDEEACWVESLADGWLFLLPMGAPRGSLIAVGRGKEDLLGKSRLVARQVRSMTGAAADFAAYPRIVRELCGIGWLACGTAAMTFDPLCGEGAGNAAREAILACAAARAILVGESSEDVLAEYSLRLRLGFLRHLERCREFYQTDWGSEFWTSELARIDEGIVWTRAQIAQMGQPRFRLRGFSFERIRPGKWS